MGRWLYKESAKDCGRYMITANLLVLVHNQHSGIDDRIRSALPGLIRQMFTNRGLLAPDSVKNRPAADLGWCGIKNGDPKLFS